MVFVILVSIFALLFAGYLARYVLREGSGTPEMQAIADAIRVGAEAFMKRQYRTIGMMVVGLAALMFVLYGALKGWDKSGMTTFAFLLGALCSALSGYIGMYISIRANVRTANAARTSAASARQAILGTRSCCCAWTKPASSPDKPSTWTGARPSWIPSSR